MKKKPVRLTALLTALCLLLSLAGCGGSPAASTEAPAENTTGAPTEQTAAAPTAEQTTEAVTEQTTEAATEPALPVREMNALRERAVAYMKAMAVVEWTPGTDTAGTDYWAGYKYGTTIHGIPYTNVWDSSLEEFTGYLKDGVYTGPVGKNTAIGVDCTSSTLAAWGTAITDCSAVWTAQMMPFRNGTIKVGDYAFKAAMADTTAIVEANEEQELFKAYAQVIPGDAVLRYKDGEGHCRMVTLYPTVVRLADGSIDGENSFIYVTEVGVSGVDAQGCKTMWTIDFPYSFNKLIETHYIPITTKEMNEGVEVPVDLKLSEETAPDVLLSQGFYGKLKCNYRMYEVIATVTDAAGQEVRRVVDYPVNNPNNCLKQSSREYRLSGLDTPLALKELPAGTYQLSVSVNAAAKLLPAFTIDFTVAPKDAN